MKNLVVIVAGIAAALPVYAQSLRDAVEAAWGRQPLAQAQSAREAEFSARRDVAGALSPAPPSIAFGHRTDQANRNEGKREWEAEFSLPLWLPGQRERAAALADAERDQYGTSVTAAKLKIAGEVRDTYWQARIADIELAHARRKVEEAAALAGDVGRRVDAGDLARVDLNQAQAAQHVARAALAEVEVKAFRAHQSFSTLTGMPVPPAAAEQSASAPPLEDHPRLAALARAVTAAHAKLAQARLNRRDNPELELAMRRERDAFDRPFENSVAFRFRLPFATDARNRPRVAAANAELIEAQASYRIEQEKLSAEVDAARRDLARSQSLSEIAEARFTLAAETHQLFAKAFSLGELDLISRLRAENERFEAELNRDRAALETARAVARLNHSLGLLP
ncbi:MAG: TolC family protein [Betaproteobacteria bacterium]|nr:TolC family protein [Betaproteobacteria bacterium]